MKFESLLLSYTYFSNGFFSLINVRYPIPKLEMNRKLVDRASARMADAAMLSIPLSPRDAPPAHVADVQFYALTHAFPSRGPHQFHCSSTTHRIDYVYSSFPRFIEILRKLHCLLDYEMGVSLLQHNAKYSRTSYSILF